MRELAPANPAYPSHVGHKGVAKLICVAGPVGSWGAVETLFLIEKSMESSTKSDSGPLPDPSLGSPSAAARPIGRPFF